VYYYFIFTEKTTVLAWVSASILMAIGVLYIFLHFCARDGYTKEMREQLK
jgi:hypothetical protein